jgi:hemerythrin-like domain-containing protein
MNKILEKLHNDHVNISEFIRLLERQLSLLIDCKISDIAIMIDAIKYMKNYPDLVHHPLEDVVFQYYLDRFQGDHKEEILQLLQEHERMPLLTDNLIMLLESVLAGEPRERKMLCDTLQKYISTQKEHINHEEAKIYPMLSSTLNEQDWRNIKSSLAELEDPLFGRQVENTYQQLSQQILLLDS